MGDVAEMHLRIMEESELDEESAGRPQRLPVMLFAGVDGSPVSSDKAAKDFTIGTEATRAELGSSDALLSSGRPFYLPGASSRSFSLPFDEGVCEEPNVAVSEKGDQGKFRGSVSDDDPI